MPLFLCTVKARLSARRYLLLGRGGMCEFLMLTHISFQQQHVEFVSVFYYISGSTSAKPAF